MRCDKCGEKFSKMDLFCSVCGEKKEVVKTRKKRRLLKNLIIVFAIIIVALIIFLCIGHHIIKKLDEVLQPGFPVF